MSLTPRWTVGAVDLTDFPFMVPFGGVDYGAPENVTELIQSMFIDGDYEVSSRAGNRALSLPVMIEESDMAALAEAEAALEAECRKERNEVTCDPGDGFGPAFTFDVFRGQLSFSRNDDYEIAGFRLYTLTFRALPYSRSAAQVTATPTATTYGTARQQSYSFTVSGSARTEAALEVSSSATLGDTLIYTRPGAAGMIPLRQYRDGGGSGTGTTSASTNVSGRYDDNIATGAAYSVPLTALPADGTYILLARAAKGSGSGSVILSAFVDTKISSVATKSSALTAAAYTASTTYEVRQIGGAFQLPGLTVADPSAATVAVTIASSAALRLDEAWLVEIGEGALTWPDTGPGDVSLPLAKHIWVEPPSVDRAEGRLLRGVASAQADAFGAETASLGEHVLEPGTNTAFVVTAGTTATTLTVSYWPRWHTHAGS